MHAGTRLEDGLALGGRYRLNAVIGSGAGEIWSAFDQRLNRPVTVRRLPGDPTYARPAAEAAAALRHPNITAILDIAQHESGLFLVTELLDGQDLAAALTRQPGGLPIGQVTAVAVQVSGALAAAHTQGLVHGGLEPSNLFKASDGRVKVCDFGVLHQAGAARYPAPEDSQGVPADQPTDLYALGCVLFELATGRQPQTGPPVPIRSLRPGAPQYLERLLLDLQAVDPAGRPSAAAVNDFLRASGADAADVPEAATTVVAPGAPTATLAETAPVRPRPAKGSRRQFALGAIAGVVVGVVVGGGVIYSLHSTSSSGTKHQAHTVAKAPVSPPPSGTIQGPVAPGGMTPASPPLVAGWKPVWSTSHGIIYDVPPNWKVEAPDTFLGETDTSHNIVLGSVGVASISTTMGSNHVICSLVQSGVASGLGLGLGSPKDSNLTGTLDSQAGLMADDWADLIFVTPAGVMPKVTEGNAENVTIDGQAAAIVTATATEKSKVKHNWCYPQSAVIDAVAMHSRSGANITFYVMSDQGVPGSLSQAVMHQIINTIRPLG